MIKQFYKVMMTKFYTIGLLSILVSAHSLVLAQTPWVFPTELQKEGTDRQVLFADNMKASNYAVVLPHLRWFLANTPKAHINIYKQGVEVYNYLVENSTDGEEQQLLADTLLLLYDKRVEYFGEAEKRTTLPNKAHYAFYYWHNRPEKYVDLFNLYTQVIEMQGNATDPSIVEDYMRIVSISRNANREDKVSQATEEEKPYYEAVKSLVTTDEAVMAIYEKLVAICDANMSKSTKEKDWSEVKSKLEAYFSSCITIDCEYVKKNYGAKFKADPSNKSLAETLVSLMLSSGCEYIKEPLFLEALMVLYKAEPTDSRASSIAMIYQANGDTNKALEYFGKVSDKSALAKTYLNLANQSANSGNKVQARSYALEAAKYGFNAEVYTLIGNLYMKSSGDCGNSNPVLARVCFLAAYDAYQIAGNAAGMGNAQAQFPSGEDIFTHSMEVGQSIPIGCWIGGSTVLRKR
jgi:tetratricopeptide (TPR) repeat protein